jgi:hypothetical protein
MHSIPDIIKIKAGFWLEGGYSRPRKLVLQLFGIKIRFVPLESV